MTLVVVSMLACLAIAALVLGYTAFPHRREPTPGVPWLDQAVERVRVAVPVIHDGELDDVAATADDGASEAAVRAPGGAPAGR